MALPYMAGRKGRHIIDPSQQPCACCQSVNPSMYYMHEKWCNNVSLMAGHAGGNICMPGMHVGHAPHAPGATSLHRLHSCGQTGNLCACH
eukprot:365157-Chlamydomonas_euryale.AAC.22